MSTTASPLRHLPQRLQIYARFPIGVLLAWIGAAFLLLASQPDPATFATGSESGGYGTSTPAFAEVSGTDPLRIERAGEVLVVTGGSLSGATLAPSGMPGVIELRSAGGTVSAKISAPDEEGQMLLTDAFGEERYRYSPDDDGFKLRDSSGSVRYRVKVKDEKFNLYRGSDVRMLRGKIKDGRLVVRDESDSTVAWISISSEVDSENMFLYSGILALPIEQEYRLLILAAVAA